MVAVVSEHVGLRRVGRRYQGLCPFHAEKTASFSVNPELGLYHCFGCGTGGDAIQFVREVEHLDFATAVDYAMTEGPTKGKTHLGIYELDGDMVKFCFAAPGEDRPTKFTAKEGSGRTLSI